MCMRKQNCILSTLLHDVDARLRMFALPKTWTSQELEASMNTWQSPEGLEWTASVSAGVGQASFAKGTLSRHEKNFRSAHCAHRIKYEAFRAVAAGMLVKRQTDLGSTGRDRCRHRLT